MSPGRRTCPCVCGRASGASLLSRARPRPGGRCGCRLSSVVCRLSTVFIFVVPGPLGWAGGERLGVFGALFSHALAAPRVPFSFFSTSALAWGDYCFLGTPFSRPPPVGLSPALVGSWSAVGFGGDPLHSRTPFGGASRSFPLFRTRVPLLRAQVWLFGCPFLRSPKHPLAGWLARLRVPSIPVVVGDFLGPLRGGPCPCGLLAPAFSRSCTSRPRPRFFPEASFPSSLAWYPVLGCCAP